MSSPFGSLQVSLVWGPAGNEVDPDYATCLRYLADHDVLDINMARAYGEGEDLIGAGLAAVGPDVAQRFTVSTKVHPSTHASGTLSHESVVTQARESLDALGVDSVDYFLIHQPDTGGVPLEETLRAADELHRAGVFKRFVRRCPPTLPSLHSLFSHPGPCPHFQPLTCSGGVCLFRGCRTSRRTA